jgi:hypothetical protein
VLRRDWRDDDWRACRGANAVVWPDKRAVMAAVATAIFLVAG